MLARPAYNLSIRFNRASLVPSQAKRMQITPSIFKAYDIRGVAYEHDC